MLYGATRYVTKDALEYAAFDLGEFIAGQLRDELDEATKGQRIVPGSWRLESQPYRDTYEEKGHGVRRLLELIRVRKPRVVVIEGEQFVASIRTYS